ncbi:MAG: MBL fold metallo-hydrolase [Lachnospiraceae bacterium]|nr:MBL fold metallo-hydrolase [Lachnospiraceae bacterium]
MPAFEIKTLQVPPIGTNCYLIINLDAKEALVVDPASQPERIKAFLDSSGVKPAGILLTHGHFDHILQVNEFKELCGGIPVYGSEDELPLFTDPQMNATAMTGHPTTVMPDIFVSDGTEFTAAGFRVKVISTPGHTIGSVCYYFEAEKILISGDTLFSTDFGRTDFPTGSMAQLYYSITEKLFKLPDDVAVYPGHEEDTMLGVEKERNSIWMYKNYYG